MFKNKNKGFIATELLAVLFVPGAIPAFLIAFAYKFTKKRKDAIENA